MESIIVQVQNILCDHMEAIHYQWVIIHSWRLHRNWFMSNPAIAIMIAGYLYNMFKGDTLKLKDPVLKYCEMISNFSKICRIEDKKYAKEQLDRHRKSTYWNWDKLVSQANRNDLDLYKAISHLEYNK